MADRWYLEAEAARARIGAREPWPIDEEDALPRNRRHSRPAGAYFLAPPPWWPDEPEEDEE